MSKSVAETSFKEAIEFFREFLDQNGEKDPIVWTFEDDVLSKKTDQYETRFWLKVPLNIENQNFARLSYEVAQQKGLGVGLTAYARCSIGLCCLVIIPADDEDAQYMMMGPNAVKFGLLNNMPTASEVGSGFVWSLMKLLPFSFRSGNFLVYLQSKKKLLAILSK
jgi:hypothetical protein